MHLLEGLVKCGVKLESACLYQPKIQNMSTHVISSIYCMAGMNLVLVLCCNSMMIYQFTKTSDYDLLFSCRFNVICDAIEKVQRHHDLIKAHAVG